MKSHSYLISALVSLIIMTGCAHREHIYNVENHPMPPAAQQLTNCQIGERIRSVVAKHNWHCNQVTPSSLNCCVDQRTHQARIRIDYTQQCFSIHYLDTHNMNHKGCAVHPKYNKWVKLMEKDIVNSLSQGKCY